jgi:hypothetical protein
MPDLLISIIESTTFGDRNQVRNLTGKNFHKHCFLKLRVLFERTIAFKNVFKTKKEKT